MFFSHMNGISDSFTLLKLNLRSWPTISNFGVNYEAAISVKVINKTLKNVLFVKLKAESGLKIQERLKLALGHFPLQGTE